ncbi:MAG TPA: hypothetical protein DGG94_03495 [Micromonosporaceae bacterium]|nr:hypothetical protein [Micromonosporaceae bacterium]HCU48873.1 hypothetical protein [Micromonosporaceae bacterium]
MPQPYFASYGLDLSPIDDEAARALKRDHVARRVAHTVLHVSGEGGAADIDVSTTFLVDAATEDDLGRPELWETMVRVGEDTYVNQRRYATRQDAEAGHDQTVALLRKDSDAFDITISETESP